MGKATKTKIKIPENNRLMKSTGSLEISENSRYLRISPEKMNWGFLICAEGFILPPIKQVLGGDEQPPRTQNWRFSYFRSSAEAKSLMNRSTKAFLLVPAQMKS
jgi:hypothetical protein